MSPLQRKERATPVRRLLVQWYPSKLREPRVERETRGAGTHELVTGLCWLMVPLRDVGDKGELPFSILRCLQTVITAGPSIAAARHSSEGEAQYMLGRIYTSLRVWWRIGPTTSFVQTL